MRAGSSSGLFVGTMEDLELRNDVEGETAPVPIEALPMTITDDGKECRCSRCIREGEVGLSRLIGLARSPAKPTLFPL
jgi:hypothetical protein